MPRESGALGRLYSISGGGDSSGRGREAIDKSVQVQTTNTHVLQDNPLRIWALLINIGGNDVAIQLGAPAALNTGIYLFASGGWCLINREMAWTGYIDAIADTLASQLVVVEVSLQTSNPEPPGGGGGGGSPQLGRC